MKRQSPFKESSMKPVVPPGIAWTRTSVTLPTALLAELEVEREQVNADRQMPDKLSRDAFLRVLLEWARDELRSQRKKNH
jgi:hypothetical protein